MKIIKKPFHWILTAARYLYHKAKARKLKNLSPSIIASDCIGGVISHDLFLPFLSPTINLFFEEEKDFLKLINHLPEYLSAEMIEITEKEEPYPIGQITYNNSPIKIHFIHYKTFEEAKGKWIERARRVNFDNIFIVYNFPFNLTPSIVEEFEKAPYKNKVILSSTNPTNSPYVKVLDAYKSDYFHGKLIAYQKKSPLKRYIDEMDYISFLNNGI